MRLLNRHRLWHVAVDAGIVALAWWLAWHLRFDQARPIYYDRYLDAEIVLLVVAIKLPVFVLSGFYNRWWRYVSTRDIWGALRGVGFATLAVYLVFTVFSIHRASVPRGVWFIDLLLCLAFVTGVRMLARTLIERPLPGRIVARGKEALVVGAGDAAQLMVKEMLRTPALGYTPIGFVDDDPRKKNIRLHGIRVLGNLGDLPRLLHDRRPDELLIAIPSASGEMRERIVEIARREQIPVKTLPSLGELVAGDFQLAEQIRPVEVEDVLGREPVEVDLESIAGYLRDEIVLVTGAGGSIGSELCRQVARFAPTAKLVLVDHAEPALFEIERELVDERRFHAVAAVVGDVKNRTKMQQVFEKYQPDVVFHAAAYKHVAMMEANPLEAVRNNTLGTRTVADVAVSSATKRFVLVSTDKAANPKTVMGQSKALCEWIVETYGQRERRRDSLCSGSVRERPQLVRQRHPDLPQADRQGRSGHGHARRDDAVLHDDSGGRAARRPGGRDRRPRSGLRARHGRSRTDRRPRREDDPPLRQRTRPGDRDRVHRSEAGREAARGARRSRRDRVTDALTRRSCA